MIDITYSNATRSELVTDSFFSTIRKTLKKYGITDNVNVDLNLVGVSRMRKLNREHRHKDYATDVLSFPIWPNLDTIKKQAAVGPVMLGGIVVCLAVATKEAAEEGKSVNEQINFLIDHSCLHLMGFHHEGDE